MRKLVKFFDKLEDKVRARLSRYPIVYAVIGGTAIILFWRGIWAFADEIEATYDITKMQGAILSFSIGGLILLITGLFASFFVGDSILISGIKKEKKIIEKTEDEVDQEASMLKKLQGEMSREEINIGDIKKELKEIRALIENQKNG